MWKCKLLKFCIDFAYESEKKSEEIFSTLDDVRLLRDLHWMKIHFDLSEKKVERLPSFRLIVSTAVEGCHYAWGAQRCSNAAPL